MLQAPIELPTSPHVIVVGNEKGGSGKTTVAMHIAIALMKAGQRVATIDLDSRQKSLTHYAENRHAWAKRTHTDLELAVHFSVARAEGAKVDENEAAEFVDFDKVITAVQHCHFSGHRHSAARQLPDAARPFDRRHAGKPAQR
jgi:chromosome partitioning protein